MRTLPGHEQAARFYKAALPHLTDSSRPALIVDHAALGQNIGNMAELARTTGKALRPHAKSHKCGEIARLQIAAGARGIATATLNEAEAMAVEGIDDILLTSSLADPQKCRRAAQLARRVTLSLVVDSPVHVSLLQTAMRGCERPLSVLVDVDVGQARAGVTSISQAVSLAQLIAATPGLHFDGIQGFAGQAQHIVGYDDRRNAAVTVSALLSECAEALADAGLPCRAITGSGTGTSAFDLSGPYTELQVGSYVFLDADYGAILERNGDTLPFRHSLYVLATVISSNRDGQISVDAGTKALAVNGPMPRHIGGVVTSDGFRFAGDEHGIILLGGAEKAPAVGTKVLIEATHCDPTVNLFTHFAVIDEASGARLWPIVGRHS